MTARRAALLALLLAAASIGAWAQPGPFTITPTSLPVGGGMFSLGQAIPLQQLGPNPQLDDIFNWAVSNGTLPPGLTLDPAAGTITGTPTQAGAFNFTILSQEVGTNFAAFQSYTVYVSLGPALSLSPLTFPPAAVGVGYTGSPFRGGGGVPNYIWALANGTNTDGLSMNASTGQLSGTPTAGGVFPMVVVLTDASGAAVNATFNLNVLAVSTTTLPSVTVGSSYSQTLAAVGGTGTLNWALTGNTFPPSGVTLNSLGQITGTPTVSGTFPFTVRVTDSVTQLSATQALSLTVVPLATISPATLPSGVVNIPYTATTLTIPGLAISNWAVTTGALPAGLSLNASTGVISGTPTVAGSSTFTISATPASVTAVLPPVTQVFTITISAAPSVTITGLSATSLPAQQAGATVVLSGGLYPLDITGTMTLNFAPAAGGSQIYDEKFGLGSGTTAAFTIPTGSSVGLFGGGSTLPVMIGTVAGTITITTVIQDSAGNPLAPPAPIVITVGPTAPVITKSSLSTANGGFSISVTGYSPTRDMTSALFHFTPTSTGLTTTDITLPLTSPFTTWYNSPASLGFGSQFTMSVPFTFKGPPGTTIPCLSVSVTLTNSQGTSTPAGVTCQAVIPVP